MFIQPIMSQADKELINKDLQHIWHPCAQMKDFEQFPPLVVHKAKGSTLYTNEGPLIDAFSSWWCKSLGHGHPAIVSAIKNQLDAFEQVAAVNTTHSLLAEFGEKLAEITKKPYVLFASDGSSAVEIALKLCLHAKQLNNEPQRKAFIALNNSYHGETLGSLCVSDMGIYKKPYAHDGLSCHFIAPPYVSGKEEALWYDCGRHWQALLPQLEAIKETVCAVIVEPLLQGSAGMLCYSADFLSRLAAWAKQNNIYLISDEIMTGIGRTGTWLAAEHAGVNADLICLSKGLTGGALPLSSVSVDKAIYDLFYDDYEKGKSFLHSHTHSANALAVSAALATLNTIESEEILAHAQKLGSIMNEAMRQIAKDSQKLSNVRSLGAMVAADMHPSGKPRLGYYFAQAAVKRGALIRPLGNTLYWLPPLNTPVDTIQQLAEITFDSLKAVY